MKKIFLLLGMSLMVLTTAFAGNEGPIGTPPGSQKGTIIARYQSAGGLISPQMKILRAVEIYSHGQVDAEFEQQNVKNREVLLTLSSSTMQKVLQAIENIRPGKSVDQNLGEPLCTDIPGVSYSIIKKTGEEVFVSAKANCHQFKKEIYDNNDMFIENILNSFLQIGEFQD